MRSEFKFPEYTEAMNRAIELSMIASIEGEVPVGAVILFQGHIVAEGRNQVQKLSDPTAHAEMIAISEAARKLRVTKLMECTILTTLEPCIMCAGAIYKARIQRVVFSSFDPAFGACGSAYNFSSDPRLNHQAFVIGGYMEEMTKPILDKFFIGRRQKKSGK
jgi:tRNA(adenine34) deaminase